MEQFEELLAAVQHRVERAASGDSSAVLEPPTPAMANLFHRYIASDKVYLELHHGLGWLHYHRAQALRMQGLPADQDLNGALAFFAEPFKAGMEPLPESMLAFLANNALGEAVELLQVALDTNAEPALVTSAVRVWERIIRHTPHDDDYYPPSLDSLGLLRQQRFRQTGELEDVDEAVEAHRAAARATPRHAGPEYASRVGNLGTALAARFERTGHLEDADQAVEASRAAVEAIPHVHPQYASRASSLGSALEARFMRTGEPDDADQAVEAHRAAVRATPRHDDPEYASRLSLLGLALQRHSERTGDSQRLDEAVEVGRAALQAASHGHPYYASIVGNLANALGARCIRTGELEDMDEAVEVIRAAAEASAHDHTIYVLTQANLANFLQLRFGRTGDLEDADQAVEASHAAIEAMSEDHPSYASCLSVLSIVLQSRFERTEDSRDVDEAVEVARAALRATPLSHHFTRAWHMAGLGDALGMRFRHAQDPADRDEALSVLGQAVDVATASPWLRVRAAREAAHLAASSDIRRAATLFEQAVLLLPEVAPRSLPRADQQHALANHGLGLAQSAIALALADNSSTAQQAATRALRLAEAGRGVLLSQALNTRDDLTDLREQHPALAARFSTLRERLDQDPTVLGTGPQGGSSGVAGRDRHHLVAELEQLMGRIRSCDGFADFGLPPSREKLLAEAAHGPVVTFNVSRYGSDALLLTRHGITSCPLPKLAWDMVYDRVGAFHRCLAEATAPDGDRLGAQQTLRHVLEWLWEVAAEPVLSALENLGEVPPLAQSGQSLPRVWWAPGGLLGLLPLHAAGFHTDRGPRRRTVMDRVISSYTPTIRALNHARKRQPGPVDPSQALIVAMPTTPGHSPLPHVPEEVRRIRAFLHSPTHLTEPAPAADGTPIPPDRHTPTTASVLARLPRCTIAHFACHGTSDRANPSQSQLLLHDHATSPLTISALTQVNLTRAQLAFLSACSTADPGSDDLLDEAIHLTSAFQLAGFPHVVGTLWPIDDRLAAEIAESFYIRLAAGPSGALDPDQSATALHQTIRAVRDRYPAIPSLWAAYLHAGA
ncbi:CHAT domain-containing protein [Streptomyces sp. NPDC050263]|uniref:CHAT domain-containing tetratricopeptide repeat protein n=1 Tax=Streptomyces sp. NPDC050263 TaxID=3155037 RepID=UPI00342A7DB7